MSSSTDTRRFAPLGVAGADADRERQAARALGYAEGWSAGQRAAAAQAQAVLDAGERQRVAAAEAARADVEHVLDGLHRAAASLAASSTPTLHDLADAVLEAAVELARGILTAELSVVDDAALAAVRRALAPLPTDAAVTVRLNPADHARVVELTDDPTHLAGHETHLVPDPTLRRGDAVAQQAGSVVDARIEVALARALDAVRATADQSSAGERS